MIRPNLTDQHRQALHTINQKKPEDRDVLEQTTGKKIAELDFHIKRGNDQLNNLIEQVEKIQEALQRAAGAYEGYIDLLVTHYENGKKEPVATPIDPLDLPS